MLSVLVHLRARFIHAEREDYGVPQRSAENGPRPMRLLIDGYNLLNATGIAARGYHIGSLERSRLGLLQFLIESLDPLELSKTIVVFDASHSPPGLPRVMDYHGLTVRFAVKYESASAP